MPVSVTASTAAAAGAVDEELFIKSFEDVPKVKVSQHLVRHVFQASGFVCVRIIFAVLLDSGQSFVAQNADQSQLVCFSQTGRFCSS